MLIFVPPVDPALHEAASFLPPDTDFYKATNALKDSFPQNAGLSEAVVIFQRTGNGAALSLTDLATIEKIAREIVIPCPPKVPADMLDGVKILSPASIPLPKNPLISPSNKDGQAALIRVTIPSTFITMRSSNIVDHIRNILTRTEMPRDAGGRQLIAAVTGSSGFGHDYAFAAKESHSRTLYVTLASVAIILILVYRAPLAAMLPLFVISIAAIVATRVLALTGHLGLHVGTAESIFVVVLIYGAGIDYSLLLLSRYREYMTWADDRENFQTLSAAALSLRATFGAILAAAGTNILGLLMLLFADYGIFRTTGPAVAIALLVAMLATITLLPATMAILGRRVFWPTPKLGYIGRGLWEKIANLVTTKPLTVLVITLIVMAYPAWRGSHQTWVYDTLSALKGEFPNGVGNAAAGVAIAKQHWPVGEIAPVEVLVKSSKPLTRQQWQSIISVVSRKLVQPDNNDLRQVQNIRSIVWPLGKDYSSQLNAIDSLGKMFGLGGNQLNTIVNKMYLSADGRASRMQIVLTEPALKLEAMNTVEQIKLAVRQAARSGFASTPALSGASAEVFIAGPTAEMIATRTVTHDDFQRIAFLVLGVILIMVMILLRDMILSLFMVFSTVISYFATLGLCYWTFVYLLPMLGFYGYQGLDWKVEIFLFVIMVAVGQDYNIFLAARLVQESRRLTAREAARNAIVYTGPVISSCGLIMAATLGSLMAGSLPLLVQLGFALALGMLIDTFIVRPLLLPSFCALTGRTGRKGKMLQ